MDDHLLKLLAIGSDPLLSAPSELEIQKLSSATHHAPHLWEMLALKNGFYAFESALHVFPLGSKPGVMDLETWNSDGLWRGDYGQLASGCFFFAEDVFGVQFCVGEGTIQTFDPETGETQKFADNLADWARLILENCDLHTGYSLARKWQTANGPLKPGFRLAPKIPFVLQGPFTPGNLYEADSVKAMRSRAAIALQIKELPDGAQIKLRVVE